MGMVRDYAQKLYSHLLMREKILKNTPTRAISQNVEGEVQHTTALQGVGIEDQNSFCLLNSESSSEVGARETSLTHVSDTFNTTKQPSWISIIRNSLTDSVDMPVNY